MCSYCRSRLLLQLCGGMSASSSVSLVAIAEIADEYPPTTGGKPYVWRRAREENLPR